jgi:DNA helicase II / ATP-dependent DNA helicase PcrA
MSAGKSGFEAMPEDTVDQVAYICLDGRQLSPQQRAAVMSGDGPALVVAGAGSGKTTTMALRVAWLVASGQVRPDQVLGLTFTNKAAGELSVRVRRFLNALRASKQFPHLRGDQDDEGGEPTISTYHAYAGSLLRAHGLRLGIDPDARLIGEAERWILIDRIVRGYDGPMEQVTRAPSTVTEDVAALAADMSEHLAELRALHAHAEAVARAVEASVAATAKAPTKPVQESLDRQTTRALLAPMVGRYEEIKRARGLIDYGDQVALAAVIARDYPEVRADQSSLFTAVLLDEYQDTGHSQEVLLSSLFGGWHRVMAVGDPLQSIYGWRGASAGTLARFARSFGGERASEVAILDLTTSYRNAERILDVANQISAPLRTSAPWERGPKLAVGALTCPPARTDRGTVVTSLHQTSKDEAVWIAESIESLIGTLTSPDGRAWHEPEGDSEPLQGSEPRPLAAGDIAVLCRRRAQFPLIREALTERGIPVEVVGVGGLLSVPEVADVWATLQVVHEATASAALLRLLTGPRWRIGPRDLVALGRRARRLAQRDRSARRPEDVLTELETEAVDVDQGNIVDALDDLGPADRYSPVGYQRLCRLRDEIRALRGQVGMELASFVMHVIEVIGVDLEVMVRGGHGRDSRVQLDAFCDVAGSFQSDNDPPTLGAFLGFLTAAAAEERGLDIGPISATDAVKVMTVHAAKGMEWPAVFVPGLASGSSGFVFPSKYQSRSWLRQPASLPYELRGDHEYLPTLSGWSNKELEAHLEDDKSQHFREERRLAYVAMTRAAFYLGLSAYHWGDGVTPLGPSMFFNEAVEASHGPTAGQPWADAPEPGARNPVEREGLAWPSPVVVPAGLAQARAWVAAAREAADVSDATDLADADESGHVAQWDTDLDLLLAERASAQSAHDLVLLPSHLSVSDMVALGEDPAAFALRLRRPMPFQPIAAARRGTAFHAWLESRWASTLDKVPLFELDDLPGAYDIDTENDPDLLALQEAFEASVWATRTPHAVEVPFSMDIGGVLVVGRMDAVFADDDGRFTVVDWKTGAKPSGAAARASSVQLAAYRLAWARLQGVPVQDVRAAFHYIRHGTVSPVDLLDADGLVALVASVPLATE